MNAKQTVIDYIEGRIVPKDFEALCDGERGGEIFDWLQSIVPEGTTCEESAQMDWDELWERAPEPMRTQLNTTAQKIEEAKDKSFEERMQLTAEMVKLMRVALEYVQCLGSVDLILSNFERGIAGDSEIPEGYVREIPNMMVDLLEQQEWARIEVLYDVRKIYAGQASKRIRKGSLSYRLNMHSWIAGLVQQYCPELSLTVDRTLDKKFSFQLDVCPEYIDGSEVEESGLIERIIAEVPEDMPKGKRKKLIKEKIKEAFYIEGRKYPRWIQSPEWPMSNGKPMKFVGTAVKYGGEVYEHYFTDVDTGERRTVEEAF